MSHAINFEIIAPRSRLYQGPFGRLFPDLRPWSPEGVSPNDLEEHFKEIARTLMTEPAGAPIGNSGIPAGYTYFGQFIDHDITLDITPLSDAEIDPNKLNNFRTPRLDLDCLYGRGPADQPYLYEHDGSGMTGRLIVGVINQTSLPGAPLHDLQRNGEGRALIGDKRNDENAIVAQIHLAFVMAHNALVDRALAQEPGLDGGQAFDRARNTLTWLYQWLVWHDFVKRIADPVVHAAGLVSEKTPDGRGRWKLGMDDVYNWKEKPFIPVEFSVAAYRFGHTMPLNAYQTNASQALGAGVGTFFPLFGGTQNDLRGFRPLAPQRVLQWDWYLQMTSSIGPFPQIARTLDTKLAVSLSRMPEDLADPTSILNVLAARNLLRGVRMKLPSGPDVARHLCIEPLELAADEPEALWYYILKEAETIGEGRRLGPVGSIIVCATFAGLLKGDPLSWLNLRPCWTPDEDPLLDTNDKQDEGAWTLASIIRMSGLPVAGGDLPGSAAAQVAGRPKRSRNPRTGSRH